MHDVKPIREALKAWQPQHDAWVTAGWANDPEAVQLKEKIDAFRDRLLELEAENQVEQNRIEDARRAQEKAQRDAHEARMAEARKRHEKALAVVRTFGEKGHAPAADVLEAAVRAKVADEDLLDALRELQWVEFPWQRIPTWGHRSWSGLSGYQDPRSPVLDRTRQMIQRAQEAQHA